MRWEWLKEKRAVIWEEDRGGLSTKVDGSSSLTNSDLTDRLISFQTMSRISPGADQTAVSGWDGTPHHVRRISRLGNQSTTEFPWPSSRLAVDLSTCTNELQCRTQ